MNAFIPLAAFFINHSLWTYIASKKKNNPLSISILLILFCISALMFSEFIKAGYITTQNSTPFFKLQTITWLPIGFLFYHLSLLFTNKEKTPTYFLYIFILSISLPIMMITDLGFSHTIYTPFGFAPGFGQYFLLIFIITFLFPFFHAFFNIIYIFYDQKEIKLKKTQAQILLSGMLIMIVVGVVSDIALVYLIKDAMHYRVGVLSLLIFTFSIFFSICNYNFLSSNADDASLFLFKYTKDAIIFFNQKGKIIHTNHAARKLLEKEQSQLFGHSVETLNIENYNTQTLFKNEKSLLKTTTQTKTVSLTQSQIMQGKRHAGTVLILKEL